MRPHGPTNPSHRKYFVKPALKVKPNGNLANRLRRLGLQRLVDSPRVREALGIPIREVSPLRESETLNRYKSISGGALLWQRLQILREGEGEHLNNIAWQRDLASAENEMGNFERSAQLWRRIGTMKGTSAQDHYAQADAWARAGFPEESREAVERGNDLSRDQGDTEAARLGLGGYYKRRGDWDFAAATFAASFNEARVRVNANDTELALLAFHAGLSYDRCFEWERAETYYRFAVSTQPEQLYWVYKLGLSLERQEKWALAAEAYSYAATSPKEGEQKYRRYRATYCLHRAGRHKDAALMFLAASENNPTEPSLVPSNDIVDPHKSLGGTTQFDAEMLCSSNYWVKKANEHASCGRAAEETKSLRRAIARSLDHPSALFERLGRSEFSLGNYESASRHFVSSRLFQRPDGIDMKQYRGRSPVANASKYAEYRASKPVDPRVVLFESFHGAQVGCNPLAIFNELLEDSRFEQHLFVWALRDDEIVPQQLRERTNVVVAARDSDLYHYYLATAGWLINNVSFPPYFVRRSSQSYLNTWHGTPIKSLGKDIKPGNLLHANVARNFLQATHIASPSSWTTEALLDKYDVRGIFTGKVAEVGSPRADRTMTLSEDARQGIRNQLGVKAGQRVVLYAPTWRGTQGKVSDDVTLTLEALAELEKVEDDAAIVFRGHHYSESGLRAAGMSDRLAPASVGTNELLAIADVLVTDYSSIFFDFLPLDRPIVFFTPDSVAYAEERGLYFDVSELPGIICQRLNDLANSAYQALEAPTAGDSKSEARERWRAKYASLEDGSATTRTIDFFFFDECSHMIDSLADKPRILMHAGLLPNGITTSVQNLASSISADSATLVNVVAPEVLGRDDGRQEQFEQFSQQALQIGRVGTPAYSIEERWVIMSYNRTKRFFSGEHRSIAMQAYAREFTRIFGTAEFDAAVEFDGYAPFWAALLSAAENVKTKLIYQHNDLYEEWSKKYPELSAVFAEYDHFDHVVAVSPSICELNRANLSKAFDVDPAKFVTAHNQINPESILSRAEATLDEDVLSWLENTAGHTFVTMGRLSLEKAQDLLLESFAEVSESISARLIVVGSGFLEPDLKKLAKRLGIKDKVLFTGQRSNPMNILKAADTFVLSSRHEGQPMVLGEAMVLGRAIISTDLPGTRDLLEGRYGALVPHTVQALAAAMIKAATGSLDLREFDADSYRRDALEEFSVLSGVPLELSDDTEERETF